MTGRRVNGRKHASQQRLLPSEVQDDPESGDVLSPSERSGGRRWPGIQVWRFVCVSLVACAFVACVLYPLRDASALPNPPIPSYTPEPPDQQEMLVLSPMVLAPGVRTAIRVVVYDPQSGLPIVGARLRVALVPHDLAQSVPSLGDGEGGTPDGSGLGVGVRPAQVFAGTTDAQGTANAQLVVPEDATGDWALIVEAAGQVGVQRLVRPVAVQRQVVCDLATDRAAYKPGETIHLRVQTSDAATGLPASGQVITLTVADGRGNQVCVEEATTSAYGLASGTCELATRVNEGEYRVTARVGDSTIQRTVAVQSDPATGFDLEVGSVQSYVVQGEPLTVTVRAARTWGEPVKGARVALTGSLDGLASGGTWRAEGETGEDGLLAFGLSIPEGIETGYAQPSGLGRLHIVARATSGDEQAATRDCWLPASAQAIQISVAPESGVIKPGIDNLIVLHTEYPDGQPAQVDLTADIPVAGQREVRSDAQGRAQIWYRPAGYGERPTDGEPLTLTVVAHDAEGRSGAAQSTLQVESGDYHVLVRPDQARYRAGEQMHVEVWLSRNRSALLMPHAVYVDVVRGGQTVSAYSASLHEGSAAVDIVLTEEICGQLELHGYVVLPDGSMVGDIRQVWVEPASNVRVALGSDREWYSPGETAHVALAVTDAYGRDVQSAISGFLAEQGPDDRWACPTAPVASASSSSGAQWGQLLAASDSSEENGAGVVPVRADRAYRARPLPDDTVQILRRVDAVRSMRRQVFSVLAKRMGWALIALSGLIGATALAAVWRGQAFLSGLRVLVRRLVVGMLSLVVLACLAALLAHIVTKLFGPGMVLVLGIGWGACLLAWLALSLDARDIYAYTLGMLLVGYLIVGIGLRYAVSEGAGLGSSFAIAVLASVVASALAILVAGRTLGQHNQRGTSGIAVALVLLLFVSAASALLSGKPERIEPTPTDGAQLAEELAGARQYPGLTETTSTPSGTTQVSAVAAALPPVPMYESPPGGIRVVDAETSPPGRLSTDIELYKDGTYAFYVYALTDLGNAGHGQVRLQVRELLSIGAVVPPVLTVGDRVDVPVVLRNTSPITQTAWLTVTPDVWFRVRGPTSGTLRIEVPGERSVTCYVPLQITERGRHTLNLVAASDLGSDQQSYATDVLPDGMLTEWMYGGKVGEGQSQERLRFRVPWSAIRGTDLLTVGLYSGWTGVLSEGLTGTLNKFESADAGAAGKSLPEAGTMAMALVLMNAHLERDGGPQESQAEAIRHSLARSYQQLLTFESTGNGFSALGGGQADLYQTAYALMCLSRMARVYPVDAAVVDRTAHWLLDRQLEHGMWTISSLLTTWGTLPHPELPSTAYAAWALIEAGYAREPRLQKAIEHLERYLDQAQDPYTLALAVHALMAYRAQGERPDSPALESAVARLAEMARVSDGLAVWRGAQETLSGAVSAGTQSVTADTERTALAVWALLRARERTDLAGQGLTWLGENRDPHGTWRSPQATLLALEALSAAVESRYAMSGEVAEPTVRVTVSEGMTQTVYLGAQDVRVLVFDQLAKGYNDIVLEADGPGLAVYQALGTYYLPWDQVTLRPPEEETIQIEVNYSSTSVAVGETISVSVGVRANGGGVVPLAVVELGLAPGLDLVVEDWDALTDKGVVAAYEPGPGQVKVYLSDVSAESTVSFTFRLLARLPVVAKTQLTRAYDLANPRPVSIRQPMQITVAGPGS